MGVSYALTNYSGTTDPAGDIVNLIEARLTAAGWTFVEQVGFTQASTARYLRVWKNPAAMNNGGTDFYVGLIKNQAAGSYLAYRAFEAWDATNKLMQRPVISGAKGLTDSFYSIAYGASTWVATAANGIVAYSTDGGATWGAVTLPGSLVNGTASYVAYGNGKFVAIQAGSTTIWHSTDGITWTARTGVGISASWAGLWFGNNTFVAIQNGNQTFQIATGDPATATWTTPTSAPATSSANAFVAYGNGVWVYVTGTSSSTWWTAPDLATWTSRSVDATSRTWRGAAWNGTTWALVANGSQDVVTSTNNTSWTLRASVLASAAGWVGVGAIGSLFVAVASSNVAATSTDGITWVSRTTSVSAGTRLAVTSNGTTVMTSANNTYIESTTDGATWTKRPACIVSGLGGASPFSHDLPGTGTGSTALPFAERLPSLATSTNYDVAVLASNSYLVVGIYANATGTPVACTLIGRFQPAYPESQSTVPALCMVAIDASNPSTAEVGLSRFLRPNSFFGTGLQFGVGAAAESWPIGLFDLGADPRTQTFRAGRAVLVGASGMWGMPFHGWVYDCIVVGQSTVTAVKAGDQVTVGGTTYTCLARSANPALGASSATTYSFFWNTTAGS